MTPVTKLKVMKTLQLYLGIIKVHKTQTKTREIISSMGLTQSGVSITGETVHIFKTEYKGKLLDVISLEKELKYELKVHKDVKAKLKTKVRIL